MEEGAAASPGHLLDGGGPAAPGPLVPGFLGQEDRGAGGEFGAFDDGRYRLFADPAPDLDIGQAVDIAAHREPEALVRPRRQVVGSLGEGQLAQQPGVQMGELGRIEARRAAAEARQIEIGRQGREAGP